MNQAFTEDQLRELEKQLSCPSGEFGVELGKNMNESNAGMIFNSVKFLESNDGDFILELGHGNCVHLSTLLATAEDIKYFGLEISETMLTEARKINADKKGEFNLYDGQSIPYAEDFFDRVLSVNTIYFWTNPNKLIREIERVLKPGGCCILTFVDKDFAQKMPFVRDRFTLYDQADLALLLEDTNLRMVETKEWTDQVKGETGPPIKREYTMIKIKKG